MEEHKPETFGSSGQPGRLLKKPEIKRDPEGRFEQHGMGLIKKTAKNQMKGEMFTKGGRGGPRAGAGRPKGSQNVITTNLKTMILRALDEVGGHEYLKTLAVENSSAFAGLLGKVLPAVLAADDSDGRVQTTLTFKRVIVWPDGREQVVGRAMKQIESAPEPIRLETDGGGVQEGPVGGPDVEPGASHVLPSDPDIEPEPNDIKDLD